MASNSGRAQRPQRLYRFSVNGVEHVASIRQLGKQFHGRVAGDAELPLCTGRSALAVRDVLQQWLIDRDAAK